MVTQARSQYFSGITLELMMKRDNSLPVFVRPAPPKAALELLNRVAIALPDTKTNLKAGIDSFISTDPQTSGQGSTGNYP